MALNFFHISNKSKIPINIGSKLYYYLSTARLRVRSSSMFDFCMMSVIVNYFKDNYLCSYLVSVNCDYKDLSCWHLLNRLCRQTPYKKKSESIVVIPNTMKRKRDSNKRQLNTSTVIRAGEWDRSTYRI